MTARRALYTKGFTLIEAVVYLALFGILMGGGIVAAYNTIEGLSRGQSHAMLEEEGVFIMGKINWALAGAQSVSLPASGTFGSQLSVNKIVRVDAGGTAVVTPVSIGLAGGNVYIDEGSGQQILNNADVKVARISFMHVVASGNGIDPERIEASTTLTTLTSTGQMVTEDFSTIDYIRH